MHKYKPHVNHIEREVFMTKQKQEVQPQPILGVDLSHLHMKIGQSLTAVRGMLGVALIKWKSEAGKPTPIRDVTLSMLVRLYNKNPSLIKKSVDIHQFYSDIGGRNTVSPSDFSLVLGRESSAYTRWMSGTNNISPTLNALIERSKYLCDGDAKAAFDLIKNLFDEECSARKVDPIADRRWTGPKQKPVRKVKEKSKEPATPSTKKAAPKKAPTKTATKKPRAAKTAKQGPGRPVLEG